MLFKTACWSQGCYQSARSLVSSPLAWTWSAAGSGSHCDKEPIASTHVLAISAALQVPTGIAQFPGEIYQPLQAWAKYYYNLKSWNLYDEGGHFAAWEKPKLLAADVESFFALLLQTGAVTL